MRLWKLPYSKRASANSDLCMITVNAFAYEIS